MNVGLFRLPSRYNISIYSMEGACEHTPSGVVYFFIHTVMAVWRMASGLNTYALMDPDFMMPVNLAWGNIGGFYRNFKMPRCLIMMYIVD